jgi:hypothetical protein
MIVIFCYYDVKSYKSKNKEVTSILYPNLSSGFSWPRSSLPVLQPTEILEDASTNSYNSGGDDEKFQCNTEIFTQSELKDVTRELGLSKEKAKFLGSRLKQKSLLSNGISMYWYKSREQEFTNYISQDGDWMYCCNIPGLKQKFGYNYTSLPIGH